MQAVEIQRFFTTLLGKKTAKASPPSSDPELASTGL